MGAIVKPIMSVLAKCKAGGLLVKGGVFFTGLGIAANYIRDILPSPTVGFALIIGGVILCLILVFIPPLLKHYYAEKQADREVRVAGSRKEAAMAEYNAQMARADASRNGQGC